MWLKEIRLRVQNMLIILNLVVYMIGGGGGGGIYDHLMNMRILNVDWEIHLRFANYEVNGYMHDLDLLIIIH
jgi:hypothetical protein